jgi:hypothetical protein
MKPANGGVIDALGNRFRKGQIVLVQVGTGAPMMAQVIEVVPPPHIEAPCGGVMPTAGRLVLQVILPIPVQSGQAVSGCWVLEQPPEDLTQ